LIVILILIFFRVLSELTYKLSSSMAEKVINESVLQQQQHQQQQTAIASAIIKSNQQSSAKGQQNEATQQQSIINTTNGVDKTHVNSSGASGVEPSLAKKLFGGVKLPFAHFHPSTSSASTATTMASSTQLANNNETSSNDSADSTVQHRLEILNNSKTKRPISTQIYDSETSTTNSNDKHRRQPSTGSPQRNQSPQSRESNLSTSNENIASDDDELAASKKTPIISKRSKTPDSRDDQSNGPVVSIKGYNSQNKPNAPTSTSMNIIKKIKDEIRSPKKENAIDASNSANAPNPAPRNKAKVFVDKLFRSNKEPTTTSVISSSPPNLSSAVNGPKAANIDMTSPQSSKNDEIKMTNDQPVQLQHFNKDRARRPNVKRPTVKNPHSSIKIEPNNEDLSLSLEDATNKTVKTPVETETSKTNVSSLSGETEDTKSSPPKQTSPAVNLLRSNQPAVSLTALANIRSELKSRLPPKLTEESATNEISSTETASSQLAINQAPASNTSSTTTTASSKLANRLSMFEQTGSIISMNPKPYKRNDLVSNSNNSSSDSASSPNQENNTNSSESNPQLDASSKTSKPLPPIPPLKPRTTAPVAISNKIATTSNDQPTQPNIFVKLRPVNTNNTNPAANGNSELSSNNEEKPIVNRLDKEKRSSVKEVVQMFSEESKVSPVLMLL
jgi:epidermal growth factor receptor substrate 15